MPKVIQEQCGLLCVIHGINNALQRVAVSEDDAIAHLRQYFTSLNESRRKAGQKLLVWKNFFQTYAGEGYTADYLRSALRDQGLYLKELKRPNEQPQEVILEHLKKGNWLVSGRYPEYGHSIAVHDGYVIESVLDREPKPYEMSMRKSPWPKNFVPFAYYRLSPTPASPKKASPGAVIELDDD